MKSWTLTLAIFATLVVTATARAQTAEAEAIAAAAPVVGGEPATTPVPDDEAALAESPWSIATGREASDPVDATKAVVPAEAVEHVELAEPSETIEPEADLEQVEPALASADAFETAPQQAAEVESATELAAGTEAGPDWAPPAAADPAAELAPPASAAVESGAKAVDPDGMRGRIHVVARGDTLWDIATEYLQTPWVWPSIWQENRDIENPHRIYPGDHIWISKTAMRTLTPDEAAEMIAAEMELATDDAALPLLGGLAAMEEPAPLLVAPAHRVLKRLSIPGVSDMSFVSEEKLSAATSIVASASPRTWLLEGDPVVLGLGEGETTIGALYDVFHDAVPVRDPETASIVGYHVEILGWIEVTAIHGDSSSGVIRISKSEMLRGNRVIDRETVPAELSLTAAPPDLEARIIFTPMNRTQMMQLDYVYLNRGAVHGLAVGAEVEVFERGELAPDRVRGTVVRIPDRRIADLIIVSVQPTTSVGFVKHAMRELNIGDSVRPRVDAVAMR
jgi:nucleoid-associated protein YgaU